MKKNRKIRLENIEYMISRMRDRLEEIEKGPIGMNEIEEMMHLNGEIIKLHLEEVELRREIADGWTKFAIGLGLFVPIFIKGFLLRD